MRRLALIGIVAIVAAGRAQAADAQAAPGKRYEVVSHKDSGDPQQIFVGGHSAGGHLAALLTTDETYLKAVGRSRKEIRGTIGVSGVYRLGDLDLKLSAADPSGFLHFKTEVRPLAMAFGPDPQAARDASPLSHVERGLPPFLILNAGWDYPPLRRMGDEFAAALKNNGCDVQARVIPWRTHETLLFDIGRLTIDMAASDAILKFVERQVAGSEKKSHRGC
jgi:arylformamidase